jgi:hypothetical protein
LLSFLDGIDEFNYMVCSCSFMICIGQPIKQKFIYAFKGDLN